MATRNTKADRILNAARERLEIARANVETAEGQLGLARAAFNAHQMAYYALERELTPKPRTKTNKPPTATQGAKEPTVEKKSDACCVAMVPTLNVVCGEREEALIHDPAAGYGGQHVFDPGKSVARAPRKSKQKTPEAQSDLTTAGATENVMSASSAGDRNEG